MEAEGGIVIFPPFSTSALSLGPASMDPQKQRYCMGKWFWKTRGIGWSNTLEENMMDPCAWQMPLGPENVRMRAHRLARLTAAAQGFQFHPSSPELGSSPRKPIGGTILLYLLTSPLRS